MAELDSFIRRLETISDILVMNWRQIVSPDVLKLEPYLDINKLLTMNARQELSQMLKRSKLTHSEKEYVKLKKHKLHQNKALKKYRKSCSSRSSQQEQDVEQLIKLRDQLLAKKKQLIWEKTYFETMVSLEDSTILPSQTDLLL